MGRLPLAQILAGLCMLSLCAADYLLYQPEMYEPSYQPVLIRTRRQAPHLNVHNIPKTGFSCLDKKLGEYYADMETRCQVYHICLHGTGGKLTPMSFVCPNGTIFSQANRVCTPFDRVYCQIQERFYESLHGDINNRRTDYGNPDDYLPYAPVPNIRNNNAITDEDLDDDEPSSPPPPPPPRHQRPPSRSRRPVTQAPPPPPPPSVRRQQRPSAAAAPPPPPPPPPPPAVRRQPNFRQPAPVFDAEADSNPTPQQPPRNASPTVRRPVYRNQVRTTTTEEPETTETPQRGRRPIAVRGPGVRVAIQPPVLSLAPRPPPVDLSNPEGLTYAQPPPRGPGPAFRLPPGLRAVARPVFPESDGPVPNTEVPQIPGHPQPFQPGPPRPAPPVIPVTRPAAPPTPPPTTTATPEVNTTPANNKDEYDYVYDYEFSPSGNSRS